MWTRIQVSSRSLSRCLFTIIGVLVALDLVVQVLVFFFHHDRIFGLGPLFTVGQEASVPTWFSTLQLGLAALILTAIAIDRRAGRHPYAVAWCLLAIMFWYLSLDEMVQLHETWGRPFRGVAAREGVFYRRWVRAAIPVVTLVGALFVPFLRSLPSRTRLRVMVAGGIFIGSALGMELFEGLLISTWHIGGFALEFANAIEEGGEMLGIALFIRALLLFVEESPPAPPPGHEAGRLISAAGGAEGGS